MDQYEARFTTLGRYDLDIYNNEEKRVQRFLEGLKPSIRSKLSPFRITTYEEAIMRAQLVEQDYELHQSEFK